MRRKVQREAWITRLSTAIAQCFWPVARFKVRPCRASEVEHEVHLFPAVALPLVIADVFEPVEVRQPALLNNTFRPDHVHGGLCRIDGQITSDDHGAFSSECPRGFAADAPAGASDDADLF